MGTHRGLFTSPKNFYFFYFLFFRCDVVCLFVCYYSFPLLVLAYYALIYSYLQHFCLLAVYVNIYRVFAVIMVIIFIIQNPC